MTDLFTTKEAASLLGIAYDNARKALRDTEPVQVIGKNKLWSWQQVEAVRKPKRS